MREVAVYEAKARLSDLLDDVAHGDEVMITRRGVAVARLVAAAPGPDAQRLQRESVAEVFRRLRVHRQRTALGVSAKDASAQGRD